MLQAIWKREQSNPPKHTVIDFKEERIQQDEDAYLSLYKRQRLILKWRNRRYQGYGRTNEDEIEIVEFNQISERQVQPPTELQPYPPQTYPLARSPIEPATPETEIDMESPRPIPGQSEEEIAIEPEAKEAKRRREKYRPRYEYSSSEFKAAPQQRDLIGLRRALSDGHEPEDIALIIVA